MKYFKLLLSIALIFSGKISAQYSDKVWCFGDSAGIDFTNLVNPVPISTGLDTRGTCASVSDSLGNLLFYSNTRAATAGLTGQIRNKDHLLMQNGDSIYGRGWYYEHTIVPNPRNDNTFYLFTGGVTSYCGFYYSVIDLNQNGGLGAVVQKNVELLGQNFCAIDGLAAIKHANGRDWWVIFKAISNLNNLYYFYLISPDGVTLDHTQSFGATLYENLFRLKPSKDGAQLAVSTVGGYLSIFDFDRCSGYFSSEHFIEPAHTGAAVRWYWDCELSLNKQFLYVSSTYTQNDSNSYVFQYNLTDTNPSLTRDTIFSIKEPVTGGLLKLGPDNKMYWSCAYETPNTFPYPYPDSVRNVWNENLSYISYPDSLGAACDFHPFSFYLGGKRTYYGLPNNPNYELGAIVNSVCDTVTSVKTEIAVNPKLNIFYHSDWQKLFVNASGLKDGQYDLSIYSIDGKIISASLAFSLNGYLTKDIPADSFSSGTYIVIVTNGKVRLSGKVVVD